MEALVCGGPWCLESARLIGSGDRQGKEGECMGGWKREMENERSD